MNIDWRNVAITAKEDFLLWWCAECKRLCFPGHVCYRCGGDVASRIADEPEPTDAT